MCDLPACWSQVFPVISSVIHVMLVTYHALFKITEKLLWKRLTCFISGQDCSQQASSKASSLSFPQLCDREERRTNSPRIKNS